MAPCRSAWLVLVLLFAAPLPSCAADPAPFSVPDLAAVVVPSDPQVSPQGNRVVFAVETRGPGDSRARSALHTLPLSGGAAQRLTDEALSAWNPRWSPDGRAVYYLAARRDRPVQVERLHLDSKKWEAVTDLPVNVEGFVLAPTGRYLVLFLSVFPGKTPAETARLLAERNASGAPRVYERLPVRTWDAWSDGTRRHLFLQPLPGGPVRDLMPALDADCPAKPFGGPEAVAVSPDGTGIVFSAKAAGKQEAWSTDAALFSVPADGSAPPTRLTANPAADLSPRFSPDGKTLAYLAAAKAGHEADRLRIIVRRLASGEEKATTLREGLKAGEDRSPEDLAWTPDGRELIASAPASGRRALFAVDTATGSSRRLSGDGSFTDPRPLADGRMLAVFSALDRPPELVLLARNTGAVSPLTSLNAEWTRRVRFGKGTPFAETDRSGVRMSGWLLTPPGHDGKAKVPVVVYLHGGPQASNLDEFHPRWNLQVLAGAGYAVIAVDFSGSTGHGQAFADRVRNDWGGAPWRDTLAAVDAMRKRHPFLDASRMAALGPSFGGYLTYWIAGQTHPFKCLIGFAGIADKTAFYFTTDELWFPEWEWKGTPGANPAGYRRHDPLSLQQNWKTPMLILHGEKDFRVPYTQGLAAFTALQRRGVPSKLVIFPNEGHWIAKPQNQRYMMETILAWLNRWLTPQ